MGRKTDVTIPNDGQVRQLIQHTGFPEMETVFMLASALGLRRAEICALTWEDIKNGEIASTRLWRRIIRAYGL